MTVSGSTRAEAAARADEALRHAINGPVRSLRVVLRLPQAAYLSDDTGPRLCLVNAGGAVVPGSVALPPDVSWHWLLHDHLRSGAPVRLGDGLLRCGDRRLSVSPDLDLRLPPLPWSVQRVSHAVDLLDRAVATAPDEEPDLPWPSDGWSEGPGVDTGLPLDLMSATAPRLVGRGPGVTPSGDDVLAAALLVHAAAGTPGAEMVGLALASYASERTTAAAVLQYRGAAHACASPPVWSGLVALLTRSDPTPQVAALLAVGHSSGRDLARGLRAGLAAVGHRLAADRNRSGLAAPSIRPAERNHA